MPTHEDPPAGSAATLLGTTEGDKLTVRLASDDTIIGTVQSVQHNPPSGEYFESPGRYTLSFEAAKTDFELTVEYAEVDGTARAKWLDLRLVEGYDWMIPITPAITTISSD